MSTLLSLLCDRCCDVRGGIIIDTNNTPGRVVRFNMLTMERSSYGIDSCTHNKLGTAHLLKVSTAKLCQCC